MGTIYAHTQALYLLPSTASRFVFSSLMFKVKRIINIFNTLQTSCQKKERAVCTARVLTIIK